MTGHRFYIYIHTHIYGARIQIHSPTHTHMHTHTHTHTHTHIHAYTHARKHARTHVSTHTHSLFCQLYDFVVAHQFWHRELHRFARFLQNQSALHRIHASRHNLSIELIRNQFLSFSITDAFSLMIVVCFQFASPNTSLLFFVFDNTESCRLTHRSRSYLNVELAKRIQY